MFRKLIRVSGLLGNLMPLGAIATISAGDDVPFPTGFRDWSAVNSMIVTKDSPISDQIGGMHLIYVNAKGLPTLRAGGSFPYTWCPISSTRARTIDLASLSVLRWKAKDSISGLPTIHPELRLSLPTTPFLG